MVLRPASEGARTDGASFAARLAAAAREAGRPLAEAETAALAAHHRLLREWGRRMNLTGLRTDEAILRRHFLEPIAAADLVGETGTLLDIGSGGGFPAIPLKVLHPGLRLILVESSERKSAFLKAVIRELGLREARVETRRVAGLADFAGLVPCRYLTSRAVRGVDGLLGKAGLQKSGPGETGPILEPGGRALLFVSREAGEGIRRAPPAGLRWAGSRRLPSGPESVVVILEPEAGG